MSDSREVESRELLFGELIAAYGLPEDAYPAMRELTGIIEQEKDAEVEELLDDLADAVRHRENYSDQIAELKARVEELEALHRSVVDHLQCPRPINGVDIPTDAKWCIDNGHCGCGLSGGTAP